VTRSGRSTPTAPTTLATAAEPQLPAWAQVSDRRRAHIARVTALLDQWAAQLPLDGAERQAWHDVGRLHDALRDAPEAELRHLSGDDRSPVELLHGPAVARRLRDEGEARADVLDAIAWHTLGSPTWGRVGRALFMADYLEPGRNFSRAERAFLAAQVPHDFDAVFREVLRHRLLWSVREDKALYAQTIELWNQVR
jgi:HD superfamily phosphohydrolase YqeK